MKAGILGALRAGKSTVFQALTGLEPATTAASPKHRIRPGHIEVPDPRLDFLAAAHQSKKIVHAEIDVLDFAADPKVANAGVALEPALLAAARELDALLIVIPDFPGNQPGIIASAEALESELMFADFQQVDRRLSRLRKEKAANPVELATLEKCARWLESSAPLRTLELSPQELKSVAQFAFLSLKPMLAIINRAEEELARPLSEKERAWLTEHGIDSISLAGLFESELLQLNEAERAELLRAAGMESPARERLIQAIFRLMGLITFYTAGRTEARAWPLRSGSTALDAAAKIHSDIARGFIRAEVYSFDDFATVGSEIKLREAGKLRLEGKDYIIQDGDVINIRFKT